MSCKGIQMNLDNPKEELSLEKNDLIEPIFVIFESLLCEKMRRKEINDVFFTKKKQNPQKEICSVPLY